MSSASSSFTQAGTSYHESHAERSVWRRNMVMADYERAIAEEVINTRLGLEEEQSRKDTKRLLGRQKALYAKAGVDISSGSPLNVMSHTAGEGELDIQRMRWLAGETKSKLKWQTEENKKMFDWYAHLAHAKGAVGTSAGVAGGILDIITSIASYGMSSGSGGGAKGAGGEGAGSSNIKQTQGTGWGNYLNSSIREQGNKDLGYGSRWRLNI